MAKTKLTTIPTIGPNMERHLQNIGISCVEDLVGADADDLYQKDATYHGKPSDRCVLYVYRLAVYYANHSRHDPEKLKWWYWKDCQNPLESKKT